MHISSQVYSLPAHRCWSIFKIKYSDWFSGGKHWHRESIKSPTFLGCSLPLVWCWKQASTVQMIYVNGGLQWSDRLWRQFNFCEEAQPARKTQRRNENLMNDK
jgi:hypothetical protein